jgi:hypothetical protein
MSQDHKESKTAEPWEFHPTKQEVGQTQLLNCRRFDSLHKEAAKNLASAAKEVRVGTCDSKSSCALGDLGEKW